MKKYLMRVPHPVHEQVFLRLHDSAEGYAKVEISTFPYGGWQNELDVTKILAGKINETGIFEPVEICEAEYFANVKAHEPEQKEATS